MGVIALAEESGVASLFTGLRGAAGRAGTGLALLLAGAALQWAASRHPAAVESLYSRALYPHVAASLGCLTAWAPFSLGEAALAALGLGLVLVLARLAREVLGKRAAAVPAIGRFLSGCLLGAGAAYVTFLLLWGLNYQRQPFALIAGLDTRPAPLAELAALGRDLVEEVNDLREGLPEDGGGVLRLADGTSGARARTEAGFQRAAALYPTLDGHCTRVKPVLASVLLARLGITGIYCPFTGEPNLNTTLPDPEIPFSASHEMAHERGFAREDEANYLGYLACRLHPDPDFRYAGALAASIYALDQLRAVDRDAFARIQAGRSPAVTRDLRALAAWSARYQGPLRRASERVNDAYLRTQGQGEGVRSYGRMVDLLLAERRSRPHSG